MKMIDQMEILREQQKILSEEMMLQSKSFKLLSEEAAKSPQNEEIKVIFALCSLSLSNFQSNLPHIYLPGCLWIYAGGD